MFVSWDSVTKSHSLSTQEAGAAPVLSSLFHQEGHGNIHVCGLLKLGNIASKTQKTFEETGLHPMNQHLFQTSCVEKRDLRLSLGIVPHFNDPTFQRLQHLKYSI